MKTNKQNYEGAREQIRNTQQTNTSTVRQEVDAVVAKFSTPTGGDVTAQDIAEQKARDAKQAKVDNRLPIDSQARKQNRTLPTPKVLNLLLTTLPDVYRAAEVVGKWVWVTFKEQPAAEIRQHLAQLGFHWNRERQTWQHPCGQFRLSSNNDPHEKYSSYYPARIRRSTKAQTPEMMASGAATAA
ncbi:MAG TPA: hypothetical protein PKO21_04760 [Verrucomicrobiota bacterium]|nr:hypothetical protein [Verrucomicrobiota bacterium]